jgi:GPI mannosyltransferase 1 subunit M
MVSQISTRGSSEGLLGVSVVALIWAVLARRSLIAGIILGFGNHLKLYPFIYAFPIYCWLGKPDLNNTKKFTTKNNPSLQALLSSALCLQRTTFVLSTIATLMALNLGMLLRCVIYSLYPTHILIRSRYGWPFIQQSFLYHFVRIDHRHNFSVYNTALYINTSGLRQFVLRPESIAFVPQLSICLIFIPLVMAKTDIASTMLAQTLAFVAFNKVCTSQVRKVTLYEQLQFLIHYSIFYGILYYFHFTFQNQVCFVTPDVGLWY